jgi:oligosaccharide repeat unit polymerase
MISEMLYVVIKDRPKFVLLKGPKLAWKSLPFSFSVSWAILWLAMVSGTSWQLWNDSAPFSSVLLLWFLAVCVWANYAISKNVLYPAFMFSAVWFAVIGVYVFCPLKLDRISSKTSAIIGASTVAFSAWCWVGSHIQPLSKPSAPIKRNPFISTMLIFYVLCTIPLFIADTARIAKVPFSLSPNFFIAARFALVDAFNAGIVPYSSKVTSSAPLISIFTVFVVVIEGTRWKKVIAISAALFLALLSTGRVAFLELLSGLAVLSLFERPDKSFPTLKRRLIYGAVAILALLTAITFLTKSETQEEGSQIQTASSLTVAYIASPVAAFDHVVQHPRANLQSNTIIEPFLDVGVLTNVYTAFRPYYDDFGIGGCIIAFSIFGLAHGILFKRAVLGSWFAKIFFADLTFALVFSPFTDEFHQIARYIYLAAFLAFYYSAGRLLSNVEILKRSRPLTFSK